MELSNMTIESPEPTNPRQIEGYESTVQFNGTELAATVQLPNEGYYAFKYWSGGRVIGSKGYYWLANKKQALLGANPNLSTGKPMPDDAPQLVYLTFNAKVTFYRASSADTVSYTFYGRKRPDFLQGQALTIVNEPGVHLSKNTDVPCVNTASDIQFVEGTGITIEVTCPLDDGGTGYVIISATPAATPDYLWFEDGFIIHADDFEGANGLHSDVPLGYQHTGEGAHDFDAILNDYWVLSDYTPELVQIQFIINNGDQNARISFNGILFATGTATNIPASTYVLDNGGSGVFVSWLSNSNLFVSTGLVSSNLEDDSIVVVSSGTLTLNLQA
jgi:hypothetical protein